MTVQTFVPDQAISLTASAIKHMASEIAKREDATAVRIAVKPSGCSGYMYEMELVSAPEADDIELNAGQNLTDYVTQGLNSVLQFRNPNATSECGCGESFSVTK